MLAALPHCLLILIISHLQCTPARASLSTRNTDPDGTTFLWLPQDDYSGSSFFDRWDFFTGEDPTHGIVNYTTRDDAYASGLVYAQEDGTVIMKGDNTTHLDHGVPRKSVRISSWAKYNGGLFVLDLKKAPWGCGVWPAFWTLGSGNWPYTGEIDIIEGVHDNEHNQVAFHTGPGCLLNPTADFTGTVIQMRDGKNNTECNGLINDNSGCGIVEWSRASYGPFFDSQGGGVFVMKWDDMGIAIWSFYRQAVPEDLTQGTPDPSKWGPPVAALDPTNCNMEQYFSNHSIIFDITFCGDWAGNSYASTTCPGTCTERLMDPNNFVNATWIINDLKVYRKQELDGIVGANAGTINPRNWIGILFAISSVLFMQGM